MFTDPLFTLAKVWKPPECPSTGEWIKKVWCIYSMEYYSSIKMNEIMQFVTRYMDLEDIMLSQISQEDKYKYIISYISNLKNKGMTMTQQR